MKRSWSGEIIYLEINGHVKLDLRVLTRREIKRKEITDEHVANIQPSGLPFVLNQNSLEDELSKT
jgi:hypothetical protein